MGNYNLKKKHILLISFSNSPWSNLWKRHQSIIFHLTKYDFVKRTLYICPDIYLKKEYSEKRLFFLIRSIVRNFFLKIALNIDIIIPIKSFYFDNYIYKYFISKEQKLLNIIKSNKLEIVSIINNPFAINYDIYLKIINKSKLVIFDMSDDFVEFYDKNNQTKIKKSVFETLRKTDITLVVNDYLGKKYSNLSKSTYTINNAININTNRKNNLLKVKKLEALKHNYEYIVGYIGWINKIRFDLEIFYHIVKSNPEICFFLVGPIDLNRNGFDNFPNIYLQNTVPYKKLTRYIQYFDAAVIPFLINEHTKGNDLLKIHDFHSMGIPIVSTNIGGVDRYSNIIYISNDKYIFNKNIKKAILENNIEKIIMRINSANNNTWDKRTNTIKDIIIDNLD